MRTVVEKADLDRDRSLIIDTVRRHLTPLSNEVRFDWLYCTNPSGRGEAWIARDIESNSVLGVASAFPRRLYWRGGEALGWVLGDFCISDRYRSLGPAVQLQREILNEAKRAHVQVWYDFPSHSMMAVYRRLGVSSTAQVVRFAKILRTEGVVQRMVSCSLVSKGIASIADPLLGYWLRQRRGDGTVTVDRHDGLCGEEFTRLAAQVSSCYGTCIQRSADYLNWRYVNSPVSTYAAFVARKSGKLCAYAWMTWDAENAFLVDLFGLDDTPIIERLLSEVVARMYDQEVSCLHVPLVRNNRWEPLLRRLGFRARESSAFVSSVGRGLGGEAEVVGTNVWFLMHGDRDS